MKRIAATKGYEILVDDEDYDRLAAFKWYAHNSGSSGAGPSKRPARRTSVAEGRKVLMLVHHIVRPDAGMVVDHINGDPWDNRRANLRVCTHQQNMLNQRKRKAGKTRFKGVLPTVAKGRFAARIAVNKRFYNLGTYSSQRAAALAYDAAALFLHGQFACLNFPDAGTVAKHPDAVWQDARGRYEGRGRALPPHKRREIARLIGIGASTRDAAEKVGCCYQTALRVARQQGVGRQRGRPRKSTLAKAA